MVGFDFLVEPAVKGLGTFAINTVKAGAGKLAAEGEQAFFRASRKYIETYQKRHCQLKVLGMREPVDLSAVYTGVKLLNEQDVLQFDPCALEESYRQTRLRGYASSRGGDEKYAGIDIANQKPYLMVLGGPGAGKSTFLRKVGLEALRTLYYEAADYVPRKIPVLLELKRFDAADIDVEKFIAAEFETCGFPSAADFAQQALAQGNLLVLLDGLDEVPSANLDNVLGEIRDFVDRYDENRFISSCRVAASGYRSRAFQRFSNVTMADFDDEQIQQFITNWFSTSQDVERETAQKCWEVLQKSENKASKELAHTPLLLTYLCLVYNLSQRFPNNRSSLYKKALRILLEEWAAEKRILRDEIYEGLSIEQEEILLSEIAYEGMVGEQLFFSKRELSKQIRTFLASTLNVPASLDSEAVLNAIEVQQGILVERAEDTYSFSHLTLQEYLTAQCLVDNGEWHKLVQQKATHAQWREIFLLLPGLMGGRSGADDFLLAMETQANTYLHRPKVRELVRWAYRVSGRDSSEQKSRPSARRVIILFVALALARALDRDLDRARALDRDLDLALALARALDLDRARDLALALALARALALDLDFARALARARIFPNLAFDNLVKDLERLRKEQQSSDTQEKRTAVIEQMYALWFSTLGLDPKTAALSREESQDLANYFYMCELMIRCKEGAVRVSPEVWDSIESRILTVPSDTQSQQSESTQF
ncbi:MAG: NACHT domain-containing protein [Cyanobacteria bacterium P01_D01_bin.105]